MAQLNTGALQWPNDATLSLIQYRRLNKWNALKSGYENLKRLLSGNLEGFPTHTPTLHDERFHDELSDEFWLAESNNLLFICANLRNLPIINYVAQYRLKSIKT
ncbi:hypothetical protein RclHR1_23000001, partial [Rhizophagus clarus]